MDKDCYLTHDKRTAGMFFISKKKILIILIVISVQIVFQCSDPIPTYYKENLVIGGINWVFRNTPPDFSSSYSICIDFNIKYSGLNLHHSEIEFVKLQNRTTSWNLNNDASLINDSLKIIGYSYYYCYSNKHSRNGSVLPVDSFKVQIGFKNGEVIERSFNASIPGSQETNGYSHVYSQDYTETPGLTYHKALSRPKIYEAFNRGDTIFVRFTISDTSAYNGHVDFFDSTESILNSIKLFRNYKSKKFTAYINNGEKLYCDGGGNIVKLPVSVLDFRNGKSISDLKFARISVTDGSQFLNESSNSYRESYCFISISPKMPVTVK